MNALLAAYESRCGLWAVTVAGLLGACGCASNTAGGLRSPFAPKGSPWTIQCAEAQGTDRARQIERIAATLRRTPGIRPNDVFVRAEGDAFARLYYGTYYRRTDPKTRRRSMPARMRGDLEMVRQLGDETGRRYFLHARPVRMPTPDVGNPAWALHRVNAEYSLQVAIFEPNDDFQEFKRAAAEYCAWLRKRGYEAYYHHANASSMVTVGTFGPEAVITGTDGRTYYSNEVLALQRDKNLRYNLLNGSIYRVRNDAGVMVRTPSFLVEVPQPGAAQPW